jgi:hypothetical protein
MKKQILFSFVAILFLSMSAIAHAPKKIELSFNKETKTLSADIFHKVKDVEEHFISDVIIYINDVEVQSSTYEKQANKLDEKLEFKLETVKEGDVIQLKAKCNKFGSKSSKITVE